MFGGRTSLGCGFAGEAVRASSNREAARRTSARSISVLTLGLLLAGGAGGALADQAATTGVTTAPAATLGTPAAASAPATTAAPAATAAPATPTAAPATPTAATANPTPTAPGAPLGQASAPGKAAKPAHEPPSLRAETELRFGKLVVMDSGAVVVPPTGLDVRYSGAVPLRGAVGAATFLITGRKNEKVEIFLPGTITVHFGRGGQATVERITASADVGPVEVMGPTVIRLKLDHSGQARLHVGGTLNIQRNGALGALSVPIPVKVLSRGEAG